MVATPPRSLLRGGLLEGSSVLVAAAPSGGALADAAQAACAGLGAQVAAWRPAAAGEIAQDVLLQSLEQALEQARGEQTLILDAAALFGDGGGVALIDAMQATWNLTVAFARRALLEPGRPGRILLVAPASGEHAGAARAALENLARTLSIEWARHSITAVAIAPGTAGGPVAVAEVLAYLCSPAGDYFSGCLLELAGP